MLTNSDVSLLAMGLYTEISYSVIVIYALTRGINCYVAFLLGTLVSPWWRPVGIYMYSVEILQISNETT